MTLNQVVKWRMQVPLLGEEGDGDLAAREAQQGRAVILDVGGQRCGLYLECYNSLFRFTCLRFNLMQYPATRLGKLMRASTVKRVSNSGSSKGFKLLLRSSSSATSSFLVIHPNISSTGSHRIQMI